MKPTGTIKIICAWCKAETGTKPCPPEQDGLVSHGICPECAKIKMAELAEREGDGG